MRPPLRPLFSTSSQAFSVLQIFRNGSSSYTEPLIAIGCKHRSPACQTPRQSARSYAGVSKSALIRDLERSTRAARTKPEQSVAEIQREANAEYFKNGGGPLFPGTFVSLPISLAPRTLRSFLDYQYCRLKQWVVESLSILSFKLSSMPNWTTRPRWKARRGRIPPTAKAMYQEVLEAYAAGDRVTIQKLCVNSFMKKLTTGLENRNPKERVHFEFLKYNKKLFYPKLVAHQVHQFHPYDKTAVTEQAIVAIASTQKVSRYDALSGKTIPGTAKIQDKLEYVVLSRHGRNTTFEFEPWRVWGTVPATTLESHYETLKLLNVEHAKRAGWRSSPK